MSPGRVLGGRYTVGEVIGCGGMADVRVGHDTRTGRSVAIKALRSTVAEDPLLRSSLRREAQLLGRVRHHAIVSLLDAGHDEDVRGSADTRGAPYIVMEYVDGRSLRDLLRAGQLTPETSVRYQIGVLSALEASHRAGIIHRDIKPANVMVTPNQHVHEPAPQADTGVPALDAAVATALAKERAERSRARKPSVRPSGPRPGSGRPQPVHLSVLPTPTTADSTESQ